MGNHRNYKIAVLGVCASGKTTLVDRLCSLGYNAFVVSQEHSYIRKMWSLKEPDYVVVLDCSHEAAKKRRPSITWGPRRLADERERLKDAILNCDVYIDTSEIDIDQVLNMVLASIDAKLGNTNPPEGRDGMGS